jgi:hypothetical protein
VGVGLIVMRPGGAKIELPEWTRIVALDPDLRMRGEAYVAQNPTTGERIKMKAGEADAELRIGDGWRPFLGYREGRLTTRFITDFKDAQNPLRVKIAAVARQLGAIITTDAGDDWLDW